MVLYLTARFAYNVQSNCFVYWMQSPLVGVLWCISVGALAFESSLLLTQRTRRYLSCCTNVDGFYYS